MFANNISQQVISLQKDVEKLNHEPTSDSTTDLKTQESFLSQMAAQQELFRDSITHLQPLISNGLMNDNEANNESNFQLQFEKMSNQLEEVWDSQLKYHTSLNIVVISSLLLFGTVVLYFGNAR